MARKAKTIEPQVQSRKYRSRKPSKAVAKAPAKKRSVRKTTKAAKVEIEDEEEKVSKSIVPAKYRARYAPNDDRCGDELANAISEAICSPDPKTGKPRVDMDKLRRLGEANGIDAERWSHLNVGQKRMCLGNCLRAKARKGQEIQWTA